MTDLRQLERDTLAAVDAAKDERALEDVRVGRAGQEGRDQRTLEDAGLASSPDERKDAGARFNALRDRIAAAIEARKSALQSRALDARLASERVDVTLPRRAGVARHHPSRSAR